MNQADALDIVQSALWTIIVASGPAVGAAMAIGVIIALLQALTQVQDQTVAFVPKIVAMFIALILCLPWLTQKLVEYSELLITNIPKTIAGQ